MADIDQTLLTQQRQEKEFNETRLAAQNEEAQQIEPVVSITQATEARDTKKSRPVSEEPEEMEADIRAEQLEAQNRERQDMSSEERFKTRTNLEQIQQVQKMAKSAQTTARTVNFTSAASIIGLIITFITMNLQLILGNIFGVTWVPKLETWEMVLIGVVDFILWLVVILIIGLMGAIVSPLSVIGK